MQRLFLIREHGGDDKISFSSKAMSTEGVFRSFLKNPLAKYLKSGTIYVLYTTVNLGYQKIGCAYFNGKAFVKVAYKAVDGKMYVLEKGAVKECQE